MPIYAYRCAACGAEKDVLQKFSDAPLTTCPVCAAESFGRVLTAPAFQLKGSGWYATDFRDGNKPKPGSSAAGESASGDAANGAKSGEKSGVGAKSGEAAPASKPAKADAGSTKGDSPAAPPAGSASGPGTA